MSAKQGIHRWHRERSLRHYIYNVLCLSISSQFLLVFHIAMWNFMYEFASLDQRSASFQGASTYIFEMVVLATVATCFSIHQSLSQLKGTSTVSAFSYVLFWELCALQLIFWIGSGLPFTSLFISKLLFLLSFPAQSSVIVVLQFFWPMSGSANL